MTWRTVRDSEGTHYVLEKESAESSLVRDPRTGKRLHLPNEELEVVTGESPLVTAASAVSGDVRRLLTAVHDERMLGLLLELERTGPMAARTMLSSYDLCESDLYGMVAELQAAGMIRKAHVAGERGYATTDRASEALDALL